MVFMMLELLHIPGKETFEVIYLGMRYLGMFDVGWHAFS